MLTNKIVLITGASRGIGEATAKQLAGLGAHVLLLARTESDLKKVADDIIGTGGRASIFPVDLSNLEEIKRVADAVSKAVGTPDVIVNNAGLGRWLYTEETPPEEAEMMFSLPFKCAFHITREFLPGMLERGSGHIVNVNSPIAVINWPGAAAYASSRWALRGFSGSLRVDLHGTGVKVSHVVLGKTSSNYFEANPGSEERIPSIAKMIPELTPEDAARYIIRAIRTGRKEITAPFMLWLFRKFQWLTPGLVRFLLLKTGYQRPKGS